MPIERIRVGDKVWSRNRTTGKQELKTVTALTAQHRNRLIELRIEGEAEPLRPSLDHPFWVRRASAGHEAWIEAGAMLVGDLVLNREGNWRKVLAVKPLEGLQTVYNFEVDGDHDYFVGESGILVHNAICRITPGSLPPDEEKALADTLGHIDNGTEPPPPTNKKWGTPFENRNDPNGVPRLPGGQDSASPYQEYRVAPPPGTGGAGPLRVVQDSTTGNTYYTWTHYGDSGVPAFVQIR